MADKITQLPSGSYRIQVYVGKDKNGKRIYESFTDPDKKKVKFMAAEFAIKRNKREEPDKMTMGEALDRYIEMKSAVLSPSTIRGYKQIRNQYLDGIMGIDFKSLKNEKIQLELNKEIKSRNLSTKTLRNITGLISSTLKEYYPDFQFSVALPQKQRYEAHIPTIEEVNMLLRETTDTDLYIPIMLSVCLGLRRSEICALEWKDIDFKNCTIKISKAKVLNNDDGWEIKNPKSYAGNRVVKIPSILIGVLQKEKTKKGALIKISPTILSHRFIRLVDRLGLQHFRFHDLRHFNASVMLALNIPDKYAMERMGHSTPNMLKTVYQHTFDDKKDEINNAINNYLETNMQHDMQHEH